MDHRAAIIFPSVLSASASASALRRTFGEHLVSHPVESHFEVLHTRRVDDGIQKGFQDDQTVDGDADGQSDGRIETLERHDAVLAIDDEPNDGRHPANDKCAHDQ